MLGSELIGFRATAHPGVRRWSCPRRDASLPGCQQTRGCRAQHADETIGGRRSPVISRMPATSYCEFAAPVVWKATQRPPLAAFAPVLITLPYGRQQPVHDSLNRKRRPGLLADSGAMERAHGPLRRQPIEKGQKLIETCRPASVPNRRRSCGS